MKYLLIFVDKSKHLDMSLKNQLRTLLLLALLVFPFKSSGQTVKTADLHIRDPFVVVDQAKGVYYLYRSATDDVFAPSGDRIGGVEVFTSKDLENWEGPVKVLTVPEDNWIHGTIWAPEVHKYRNKYYIFATLNTDIKWKRAEKGRPDYLFRGTQVFWSKSPMGPFKAFDKVPFTPQDQMCLDGTLWVEDGQPYMVYCHEWVETVDGEMMVRPLKKDLSAPAGDPMRLFCASAAPWVTSRDLYVTDGPFLYKTKNGKLLMIWSSFGEGGYAVGIAESTTGKITGPWKQHAEPLYSTDGGHGMIFKSLDGRLFLSLHGPNGGGLERARFIEIEDTGDNLILKK